MNDIPNLNKLRDLAKKLKEEFNLESRLNRYVSSNPELLEFASNIGLENPDDASRALFVSDYIVTSSEVPSGSTDEERRESVIRSIMMGLSSRCSSSDSLLRVLYLSTKIASLIRQNDAFMTGRGLERKLSLLILKDAFLTPYLAVTTELLGIGECDWELGILSSALKKTFPHNEIAAYDGAPIFTEISTLLPYTWKLLNEYEKYYKLTVNDNLVVPYIEKSKIVFIVQPEKSTLVSTWNTQIKKFSDANKTVISPLLGFLDKSDQDKPLIYLRGNVWNTDDQLMFIRNPYIESKPLTIMRTPADEINLTEQLGILEQRGLEALEWKKLESIDEDQTAISDEPIIDEKSKIKPDTTEIVSTQEVKEQTPEITKSEQKKPGFFSKLKSIFQKSPKPEKVEKIPEPKKSEKPEKTKKKKVSSRARSLTREMKKQKVQQMKNYLPSLLSHSIGVEAVGDLNLFEIFDTFRESQYFIIGALESSYKEGKTNFLTKTSFIAEPSEITEILDGLDTVLEQTANFYFSGKHQIRPTEILFVTKADITSTEGIPTDERYIICLDGNEDRLVGTIAITYVPDSVLFPEKVEEDILKRRTLHMRTGQLLTAIRHTPFDEAIKRIYGDDIVEDAKILTLDHPILPLT
ncbi:MAG: hypothetical protein ACXAC7_20540 [Candidatus Hodarchaeales archaeon]